MRLKRPGLDEDGRSIVEVQQGKSTWLGGSSYADIRGCHGYRDNGPVVVRISCRGMVLVLGVEAVVGRWV
jgi:hypothetical protein